MKLKRPSKLEMDYISLCGCTAIIKFKDSSGLVKVCTGKNPFIRMQKEFPAKFFDEYVQQVLWVSDEKAAQSVVGSRYLSCFGLQVAASKEGVRTIEHSVMVGMASRVVAIAREEFEVMKSTKTYRRQRKAAREAIMADRLLGLKSRTMRDFNDRIIKTIIEKKLKEGR